MSGKREMKKIHWLSIGAAALCLIGAAVFFLKPEEPTPDEPEQPGISIENVEETDVQLSHGLVVSDIGSYTGLYMEDGSDEVLAQILMLVVTNTGDKTVQYAEISLTDGTTTANFALTTLPPGESAVLLEQNRMAYDEGKDLTQVNVQNVAYFPSEPVIHSDKLSIQSLDGMMNVTNISGEDISGDVVVYYKNASTDMLYGGITYRVTISGGIKADEIKQVMAGHASASGSRIMFTTIS